MKRTSLLVVLVLLVAAVSALLWFARTDSNEQRGAAEPLAAVTVPAPETKQSLEAHELEADASAVPERASVAEEQAARAGELAWDEAASIWVEGTVRFPTGCTEDDALEAYATKDAIGGEELLRKLNDSRESLRSSSVLSHRKVDAQGRFRVPFPPGTESGHVTLAGHYLSTPDSLYVDLRQRAGSVVLEPKCGAWIQGEVVLPHDATTEVTALDGLEVEFRTSRENFSGSVANLRNVRRDAIVAGGRFEYWAVPSSGMYTLACEPTGYAGLEMRMRDLVAGRANPVRVVLLMGGTIRGVVRGPASEPIAGAMVAAQLKGSWFGFDNRTVREATSGADGAFELTAVTPGKVLLKATHAGHLEADPVPVNLQDRGLVNDVTLEVLSGKSISGTVTWADATPAANVDVNVEFDRAHMVGMEAFNALKGAKGDTKTDAEGRFSVGGLGAGPFVVSAKAMPPTTDASGTANAVSDASSAISKTEGAPERSKIWEHRARLDGVKPGASDLVLVLRAPEGIQGRVVTDQGAPLSEFEIKVVLSGKGPMGSIGQEARRESFKDPEGRFLFTGLYEGTWKFLALAEGFAASTAVELPVPRAASDPEFVITLVRAATVSGVVKNAEGTLVPGATVRPDDGEPSWMQMMNTMDSVPTGKSDAQGAFTITGIKPGQLSLVATAAGHARSTPLSLELAAGEVRTDVEIRLTNGGALTGEVFRDDGEPAASMLVQATDLKNFDSQMAFTDGRGKFAIEHLTPGSYQVVAMPAGQGELVDEEETSSDPQGNIASMMSKLKMTTADIKEGEETHVVLGAPPSDPVRVHGRVTHSGEPYKGALVTFVAEGKNVLASMKNVQVADDGSYSVKVDAPGNYVISVQKLPGAMGQQGLIEFAREIPKVEEHTLDLEMPTARISGRVVGPDGKPAKGARISLTPQSVLETGTMWGGVYQELATDTDGRYDIPALRPGTYSLMAGGMSFNMIFGSTEAALGREVRGDLKLSEGEWMRDVDFRLKGSGTIDIEVVDDRGAIVGDAAVFARDKEGRILDRFSMLSTDSGGHCKYHGLAPGEYTFSARKNELASVESSRVRLSEGEPATCKLVLQPGTLLLVTTTDGENKPVRAGVSVQDSEGREVGGMIALTEVMKFFSDGGFSQNEQRVGPLPPGKYRVRAMTLEGKSTTKPVTLTGQPERKITLKLD